MSDGTATVTSIITAKTGRVYVNWSDGTQQEFSDLAALKRYGAETEAEMSRKLIVTAWVAQDPDAKDTALVVGKTAIEVSAAVKPPEKPIEKPIEKGG